MIFAIQWMTFFHSRFADIHGLDLLNVKVFNDGMPEVPLSAFKHLGTEETNPSAENILPDSNFVEKMIECMRTEVSALHTELMEERHFLSQTPEALALVPLFKQPGLSPTFMSLVQSKKICLERVRIESNTNIFGLVRVLNLAYHKLVKVVWTNNNWKTVNESFAEYVDGSSEGGTDKFSFQINCGEVTTDTKVELCLMLSCDGDHWDNNLGTNYKFRSQIFNK